MYRKPPSAWLVSFVPLMLLSSAAFSDGVAVNITNDGTDAIVVTIYDTSIRPRVLILSQRVNGFASIPVNLSQDPTGRGNLVWTAVTVDQNNRRCGRARSSGLSESASITVHADSSCEELASSQ